MNGARILQKSDVWLHSSKRVIYVGPPRSPQATGEVFLSYGMTGVAILLESLEKKGYRIGYRYYDLVFYPDRDKGRCVEHCVPFSHLYLKEES